MADEERDPEIEESFRHWLAMRPKLVATLDGLSEEWRRLRVNDILSTDLMYVGLGFTEEIRTLSKVCGTKETSYDRIRVSAAENLADDDRPVQ